MKRWKPVGAPAAVLVASLLLGHGVRTMPWAWAEAAGNLVPGIWMLAAALLLSRCGETLGARFSWGRYPAPAAAAILVALSLLLPASVAWPAPPDGQAQSLAIVLPLVLVVPAAEEVFFRGVLLVRLEALLGLAPAVLLSSLLFGLLHLPTGWPFALVMAVAGIGLCSMVRRGATLLWAAAAHLCWNAHGVIRNLAPGTDRWILVAAATACVAAATAWGFGNREGRDA